MKKIFVYLLLIISLFIMLMMKVNAKEVNVYVFYGKTCPHCESALEYLESIKGEYDLNIIKYEVWENMENRKIMDEVSGVVDINVTGVPFCVINNTGIMGYSPNVTDEAYKYHIKKASKDNFVDDVGIKLGIIKEEVTSTNKIKEYNNFIIKFPLFGKINLKDTPILISLILLGIKDGFDFCAIWVLLFFMSILICIKNRKNIRTLSIVFLLSSVLTYLLFLISKVSFEDMLNYVVLAKTIIIITSLLGGTIIINNYLKTFEDNKNYHAFGNKKMKNIILRIKKFICEKSFFIILLSVILLAIFNILIKLSCSAGVSDIFASILKLNDLKNIIYGIIYILFFMLKDFILLMIYIKIIDYISKFEKYNKYLRLIGGVLMFVIGVFILIKIT